MVPVVDVVDVVVVALVLVRVVVLERVHKTPEGFEEETKKGLAKTKNQKRNPLLLQ